MVRGAPGLDVSSLVRGVLTEFNGPSEMMRDADFEADTPLNRLSATAGGLQAIQACGTPARALDVLSSLSIEVLYEYLRERLGPTTAIEHGLRFLAVPGMPSEPPVLLVLDPSIDDVSQSRLLTHELNLGPQELVRALDRLRMSETLHEADLPWTGLNAEAAIALLWTMQPQVIVTRRPRMEPLCAPSPHVRVDCGTRISTAGIFCRDADGALGVTACLHGTGPVGTAVTIKGAQYTIARVDVVQDIVFIPLGEQFPLPKIVGRAGVRSTRAPSEAEPVFFDGATSAVVHTRVKSHDAGILRKRPTIQLKVQTPADANQGDSGAALIDDDDRIVAFAFERSGFGEFPELTDWIWADNALAALGLTPI